MLTKKRAQQLWGQVEGWPGRFHRPLHGGPARFLGCACRTSKLTPVLPAVPGWLPVREADCWPGPEATLGLSTGPGMGSRDRCLRTLRFPGDRTPPDTAMWRLEPRGSPQNRSHPRDFSSLILAVSLGSLNAALPCGKAVPAWVTPVPAQNPSPGPPPHPPLAQHPLSQSFPLTISMTESFHL